MPEKFSDLRRNRNGGIQIMKLSFGFGNGTQEVEVPDKNLMAVLMANEMEHERR